MHPWMAEQLNRQHIEDLRSLGRPFGVSFRWRRLRRQGGARLKARSGADRETNAVELGARGTTGGPSLKRAASSHPRRGSGHRLRRGPTEVALGCSEESQPGLPSCLVRCKNFSMKGNEDESVHRWSNGSDR